MRSLSNLAFGVVVISLLTGCSSITNLTPGSLPRNSQGLYPVEAAWSTSRQAIKASTIRPSVIVDSDAYVMEPVPVVKNRWQVLIPVEPGTDTLNYRFKFDYRVKSMPQSYPESKLSKPFQLRIVD